MSKRLQVVMDDQEWQDLHDAARREGATLSEWARRVLREAQRRQPGGDSAVKLAVVRSASRHQFPSGDIDQVLREIELGYVPPPV